MRPKTGREISTPEIAKFLSIEETNVSISNVTLKIQIKPKN